MILHRSAYATVAELLAAGRSSTAALYVVPIADLPEILAALRARDDVVLEGAPETLLSHRASRTSALAHIDRDPLTGLFNRRYLEASLEAWEDDLSSPRPVRSVVLIDLDRFKAINDEHGHPAGDLVLRELSRRVALVAPAGSVTARFGGDEIAILLDGAGHDEALGAARAVHRVVRDRPYEGTIRLTVSVAAATGGAAVGGTELLRDAEQAMYAAKAGGRDRFVHAADVRRAALAHNIDPDVQGFEHLTRVIAERVAEVLSRRGRKLFEQIQQRADVDALTGLFSRHYMDRRLSFEVEADGPLCAALIDVDWFGRVNKAHGWPVGDAVLAGVSRRIVEGTRDTDWTARYGGEEILVVLPATELADAADVIERIRQGVSQQPFPGPDQASVAITISAGVARLREGEGVEAFTVRISAALLRAKGGGRDQVAVAAEP